VTALEQSPGPAESVPEAGPARPDAPAAAVPAGAAAPATVPGSQTGAVLEKAAAENFPVAPFFLPARMRDGLMAVYGFARLVDDIGDGDLADPAETARALGVAPAPDSPQARLELLDAAEADLDRVFAAAGSAGSAAVAGASAPESADAEGPRHPLLRALVPAVRAHHLTDAPFRALIEANRVDQQVTRYADYQALLDYCVLSANPVGRMVLELAGLATPERVRQSDAICTALQIAEHLQDVAEDRARGRIYLPAEDLARFGVAETDLDERTASGPLRDLVAFEVRRARALLDEGAPLVGSMPGRLRVLLAGFAAGGRAALDAIADAGYDVLAGAPKAGKGRLLRQAAVTLVRGR